MTPFLIEGVFLENRAENVDYICRDGTPITKWVIKTFPQQWDDASIHFLILYDQMNPKMQRTELPFF